MEGTIKKKEKEEKEEEKKKDWQAFCYAMRSNAVQLLMSGGVGTFTNFQFYIHPNTSQCLFVCLYLNCSLLFLRDTTDLSEASWKYVSDGKHRPALHSIWFRKLKIDYLSTQTCDVKS